MRALVLKQTGQAPVLGDFDEPVAADGQVVAAVEAAAINPYDRTITNDPKTKVPRVVGLEGVGLVDGKRSYLQSAVAPFGTVAEKVLLRAGQAIELPEGLSTSMALTIGTAGWAAWLPLSWKAQLKPGESVLILGATGVQGQIAVQAAKLQGAGRVIAAGRNRAVLEGLKDKGADDFIVLEGDLTDAFKKAAPKDGYDVVIDSVFGPPFEALIKSATLNANSRVAVVGGGAGNDVRLNFRELQAVKGATIAGYSTFYVPDDVKKEAYLKMAEHVIAGNIKVDVQEFTLDQAEAAWAAQAEGPHSKIVVNV